MQVCRYVRMYACSIYVAYIYIYMHIYTHAYTHVYFVSITKLSSVSSCFQDLDNVPYLSAVINEGPSCASNDHQVWGLGLGFRASLGFSLIGSRIRAGGAPVWEMTAFLAVWSKALLQGNPRKLLCLGFRVCTYSGLRHAWSRNRLAMHPIA